MQLTVGRLVIFSSSPICKVSEDIVIVSRKFVAGIEEYRQHWSRAIHVICEPAVAPSNDLDNYEARIVDLPFMLSITQFKPTTIFGLIEGAAAALMLLYHRQSILWKVCDMARVPAIYTSEYTLRTRCQIINSSNASSVKKLAKIMLEIAREVRNRQAISRAAAVQCNGLPTYRLYAGLNQNALLFFDTRVSKSMLASEDDIVRKATRRREDGMLRLAFSGRLITMKGVDDLVTVAAELKRIGRPFTLDIYGTGDRAEAIGEAIRRHRIGDVVRLRGNVDFQRELIPAMRASIDLFVCCHTQGDPACTYLETMSCGVPIAGYANEAFEGLVAESGSGWLSALGDPLALARQLASITNQDIDEQSKAALAFAGKHTFEVEFAMRIAQVRAIAQV